MFKKPWFRIALNFALSSLKVGPITVNPRLRTQVVDHCLANGLSPKEGAVVIYYLMPPATLSDAMASQSQIKAWVDAGHVRQSLLAQAASRDLLDSPTHAMRESFMDGLK